MHIHIACFCIEQKRFFKAASHSAKQVADRSLLDTGDVPITLEREKREEVQSTASRHRPVLAGWRPLVITKRSS